VLIPAVEIMVEDVAVEDGPESHADAIGNV
jgi:hypothetical protein